MSSLGQERNFQRRILNFEFYTPPREPSNLIKSKGEQGQGKSPVPAVRQLEANRRERQHGDAFAIFAPDSKFSKFQDPGKAAKLC